MYVYSSTLNLSLQLTLAMPTRVVLLHLVAQPSEWPSTVIKSKAKPQKANQLIFLQNYNSVKKHTIYICMYMQNLSSSECSTSKYPGHSNWPKADAHTHTYAHKITFTVKENEVNRL